MKIDILPKVPAGRKNFDNNTNDNTNRANRNAIINDTCNITSLNSPFRTSHTTLQFYFLGYFLGLSPALYLLQKTGLAGNQI